jgi:AcrR family transcriptional regulator
MAISDRHDDRSRKIDGLLDSALVEFSRVGPDGARVDAIARAAGMNKRLLYHYVGDKQALFAAVLERACARVQARPQTPMPDEWRVICYAVAAGVGTETPALNTLLNVGSEVAAEDLGLVLLASLLPALADRLLENGDGTPGGRIDALARAMGRLQDGGTAAAPSPPALASKPRVKLRPDLRASAGSEQRR